MGLAGALWRQTAQAAGLGARTRVHGVGDGAEWITNQFAEQFAGPGKYLVDFWHVSEYLAAAWRRRQQGRLLENKVAGVLRALAPHLEAETQTEAPVRAAGLPIGSGEIQSGHRHVIQQRLKLAGGWWKQTHAEAMLGLRVARANHRWNSYWSQLYTGDTKLLTERTEISGSPYSLKWSDEFQEQLRVPQGTAPSPQQFNAYHHSREYIIPVLNQGQRAVMTYFTTVPTGNGFPGIWFDTLHEGVRIQHCPAVPQVHVAPLRHVFSISMMFCLVVVVLTSLFISEAWAAAVLCMFCGLLSQRVGASIYRGVRFFKPLVIR